MNVWVIRLSMARTLDAARAKRFSEPAQSAGGAKPGHRPARGNPQPRAFTGESATVGGRRLADDLPEGAAERPKAGEADIEADLRHRTMGLAQQLHRPLHPGSLQISVRSLPEGGAELAAEVRRRDVRHPRQGRHVESLREGAIHRVARSEHPPVAILDRGSHHANTTCRNDRWEEQRARAIRRPP